MLTRLFYFLSIFSEIRFVEKTEESFLFTHFPTKRSLNITSITYKPTAVGAFFVRILWVFPLEINKVLSFIRIVFLFMFWNKMWRIWYLWESKFKRFPFRADAFRWNENGAKRYSAQMQWTLSVHISVRILVSKAERLCWTCHINKYW